MVRLELADLKSHFVTSSWGGTRKLPYVFVRLKGTSSTHKELARRLSELEGKFEKHDGEIKTVFEAIRQLMAPPEKPKRQIGFRAE